MAVVALLAAATSGCGPAGEPTGSVRGQVTFNQNPISDAHILFENGSLGSVQAVPLGPDGSFSIEALKTGEYVVAVIPPETQGGGEIGNFDGSKPMTQTDASAPKSIPAKFSSTLSSPLRHTVIEGQSEFSVDLAK